MLDMMFQMVSDGPSLGTGNANACVAGDQDGI